MTAWQYAQIRVSGGVLWWTGPGEDYKVESSDEIERLNAAGAEGWELVGVASASASGSLITKYVLKRQFDGLEVERA